MRDPVVELATLEFVKMHGLGNDYLFVDILDRPELEHLPWEALTPLASDRHTGAGADGVILILPGTEYPFRMRVFNADGSEGEMCGNGIRCVGKLLYEGARTRETSFVVETAGGPQHLELSVEGGAVRGVRVDMGAPRLARHQVPMLGPPADTVVLEPLVIAEGESRPVTALSMGNPHAVFFVDDVEQAPVRELGPRVERHPAFPNRTNVGFVAVASPDRLHVRVWERGSGETLACGTGAAAAAVAGVLAGRSRRRVTVRLPGGELLLHWADDGHVYLTGPAAVVYRGRFDPQWLEQALRTCGERGARVG